MVDETGGVLSPLNWIGTIVLILIAFVAIGILMWWLSRDSDGGRRRTSGEVH